MTGLETCRDRHRAATQDRGRRTPLAVSDVDPIKIEIKPGFQATIGQQQTVVVRIPEKSYRDTLFRAYIPIDGMPVTLDLYGEEPEVCQNDAELETRILDFLGKIKDRMASYREYATG